MGTEPIKDVISLSLAEICFQRRILPSSAFKLIEKYGKQLHAFGRTDQYSRKLDDLLQEELFDVIEKGYFRELIIGIFLDETVPTEIIESYVFKASGLIAGSSQEAISLLFDELLSTIKKLPELPTEKGIIFKHFFTSTTPDEYLLPSFSECSKNTKLHLISRTNPYEIALQPLELQSGHFEIKLYVPDFVMLKPSASTQPIKEAPESIVTKWVREQLANSPNTPAWTLAMKYTLLTLPYPAQLSVVADALRTTTQQVQTFLIDFPCLSLSQDVVTVQDTQELSTQRSVARNAIIHCLERESKS